MLEELRDVRRRAQRASLALACAIVGVLAWSIAPAQALETQTFNYTGAEQTFVVPGGVTSIHVVAIGGTGGASAAAGGAPAQVTADLSVTPGQTLYVEVGGKGKDQGDGGAGGFNGGGAGAGGGGGASDIRTSPRGDGLSPEPRLIVAAGGGGGGSEGPSGSGGNGGDAGSPGAEGEGSGNEGGGAGTETEGGIGGFGCNEPGGTGTLGQGAVGGSSESGGPGGGGGGGYYGGGGGGGSCTAGSGGGGGGSSKVAGGSLVVVAGTTAPKVEITYTPAPPTISILSPANGATYTQGQVVNAIYTCTPPAGTGVAMCTGPVANGGPVDTSSLGLHVFTVEAEDTNGSSATKSVNYTVVAAAVTTPVTTPAPTTTPKAGPPNTILGSHPSKNVKTKKAKARVKFSFSSMPAGATFECKLDKGQFLPCPSPKTYKVKAGKHKFSVQAVGKGGTDPTPATFSFKVIRKR